MLKRMIAILLLLTGWAWTAAASEPVDVMRQAIQAFIQSADYEFAPDTAARAQAFLGAAMLAGKLEKTGEVKQHLQAAGQALNEARRLAASFKKKNKELLQIRSAAVEAVNNHEDVRLQEAEAQLKNAIRAMEAGKLNDSSQLLGKAKASFLAILESRLGQLSEETRQKISIASAAGAKKYAPQAYKAAKQEYALLRAYHDGLSKALPLHPRRGIRLAERALWLSREVKQWRKQSGSHEQLIDRAKHDRLKIAQALDMAVDKDNPMADASTNAIIKQIRALRSSLAMEKRKRADDIARLNKQHDQELKQKLDEQKAQLIAEKNEQVNNLKEAFRARLERETFEKKRQTRARKLFRKGEVQILTNVDGSLRIRLTSLKFSPGRSNVDPKHFDLLGRLKAALDIYGERKLRIEGHTDNQGHAQSNQKLSLKRAEAVRDFLIAAGVEGGRLKALGYGEVHPIASNDYEKGRALNRRIDVVIEASTR